jgi:hypothetical protein
MTENSRAESLGMMVALDMIRAQCKMLLSSRLTICSMLIKA